MGSEVRARVCGSASGQRRAAAVGIRQVLPRDLGSACTGVHAPVAGLRTRGRFPASSWPGVPTGRRFPDAVVQCCSRSPRTGDGVRSRSPLRGSPGFAPGSLLPRPPRSRLSAASVADEPPAHDRLVTRSRLASPPEGWSHRNACIGGTATPV
ncbi:hypothetical protein SACE_4743 [Saccharopolyspora erythraea NRRL 2338]|uniref:Uncharacterized protein n=1 Tax=Saccharopolyspora erythraea (strain ATCC 11635 / DSM 40517 / JCM 4748 / NBRC 13426 / NCIMB 8594 / NRRL 2338) TaxID=405948 RepID=A4FIY6_SACEN|nr:hypothetical protein SACE_4743 [Saccharopolyspora erythraea NRRL 2338]